MGCTSSAISVLESGKHSNIISIPPLLYEPEEFKMGQAFFKAMDKNKDKIAQIDAITGEIDIYSNLLRRCIRTALEMRSRGITSDDIICICSHNHLNNIVPFIATLFLGARIASLDPSLPLSDTVHLVRQVEPKMIFVSTAAEPLIEEAIQAAGLIIQMVVFGDSNKCSTFTEFISEKPDEDRFTPVRVPSAFDTAIILFSSGTTGLAKGICINHYAMMYQVFNFMSTGLDISILLGFASTYWISTVLFLTLATLFGKTRLVCPKFSPKEIWSTLDKYKVSLLFGAPSQAVAMSKLPMDQNYDLTHLRDFMIAGGPLSEGHMFKLRSLLPDTNVHLAYGQTECAGIMTCFDTRTNIDLSLINDKPTACGKGLPGFDYRIVDLETEKNQDFNQSGELRVRTKYQMNGYHNVDSSDCWDSDGWLRTGDVAYFDKDQFIYIVDRIKEMLKFQAFHVVPAKIEGVLNGHPAVVIAVVIGIPHEEDGDHPMAVVVRNEGVKVTEEELVEYVEQRVDDRHRLRAGVRFVDELPYTPSGKIKKGLLKKKILAGEIL